MLDYISKLTLKETEEAVKFVKDTFENELADALNLSRVSAPLFVLKESGLNDNLSGAERPVSFDIKETGKIAEVVQSLAKWKRHALAKYGFPPHRGLYADMNAIRRDEICDELHSLYVDQWDWEKVIVQADRCENYLKETVRAIYGVIYDVAEKARVKYSELVMHLNPEITFVTTQELEDLYPDLTPKQREHAIAKKYGSVFLLQIGCVLKGGEKHDERAPDYDDWALNGDILVYYPPLDCAMELSSMGIRVDAESLEKQLETAGMLERLALPYHSDLIAGKLPLTIGGGIGQSRLCMLMLEKIHIGEVQASVWPEEMQISCAKKGVFLM